MARSMIVVLCVLALSLIGGLASLTSVQATTCSCGGLNCAVGWQQGGTVDADAGEWSTNRTLDYCVSNSAGAFREITFEEGDFTNIEEGTVDVTPNWASMTSSSPCEGSWQVTVSGELEIDEQNGTVILTGRVGGPYPVGQCTQNHQINIIP